MEAVDVLIAEENVASTQEPSVSVIEVSNIVQNISGNSKSLYKIVSNLENEVDKFKV